MAEAVISMPKAMRSMTITARVVGKRRTAARIRAGSRLLRFAAFVMGCDIDVSLERDVIETDPVDGFRTFRPADAVVLRKGEVYDPWSEAAADPGPPGVLPE